MSKHLHVVPSLMVIFFDLDWDDAQWKEKETECASRVAVLRYSKCRRLFHSSEEVYTIFEAI